MTNHYQLPTRPYGVIDAINRVAAATGSLGYAMAAAGANYNGHHVNVWWNNYRRYWIAEYMWGGRVVLSRGSFEDCVRAAKREYDRGALGASVAVSLDGDGQADQVEPRRAFVLQAGFTPSPERDADGREPLPAWWTWKHSNVGTAMQWERSGFPATAALLKADTEEEFRAMAFGRRVGQ